MRNLHPTAATALAVTLLLTGCTTVEEPAAIPAVPTPPPATEPAAAPLGSSALPLGCADLVDLAVIESMAAPGEWPVVAVIDENRIERSIRHVAALQAGALRCVWSSNFGSTGFNRTVTIEVHPSTETHLDPAAAAGADLGGRTWSVLAGEHPTISGCHAIGLISDTDYAGSCSYVQLRDGYRIHLDADGAPGQGDDVRDFGLALLERVGSAIDGADEARRIAIADRSGVPARHCDAPGVRQIIAARGGSGEPTISETGGLTECTWVVPWDGISPDLTVSVLPGGGWAFEPLVAGVDHFPVMYVPSPSGQHLVAGGDWFAALTMKDGDLVAIEAPGALEWDDNERWVELVDANF